MARFVLCLAVSEDGGGSPRQHHTYVGSSVRRWIRHAERLVTSVAIGETKIRSTYLGPN
jgi:hypothetical protein